MITLSLRRIFFTLLSVTALLAFANGLLGLQYYLSGADKMSRFYTFLDLDTEANFPTWFISVLLVGSSLSAALIGHLVSRERAPFWRHWWAVSAIFLYLSVDEVAQIHESWGEINPAIADLGGAFYYSWVVPGLALVAAFALIFARFFFSLPGRTRGYLGLASAVYLLGAVGVEMTIAYVATSWGAGAVTGLLVIAEESLEQVGAILFLCTFLDYLKSLTPKLVLK